MNPIKKRVRLVSQIYPLELQLNKANTSDTEAAFLDLHLSITNDIVSTKNSKWVWSGNTTITNRRQPRGTARKSCSTITRHQESKLSKATRSLFSIKMIAILEIYDKRDDFDFEIVNFPILDGDVPRSTSYGVYISQLICFAGASSCVADFNTRNKWLTQNLLKQGYRYH